MRTDIAAAIEDANARAGRAQGAYRPDRANRGMDLEHALAVQHEIYRREGRAYLVQQFARVVTRGRKAGAAQGQALHVAATPRVADYLGALADGRSVAVEAKDAAHARFRLDAVTAGQRDFMRRWPGLGVLVVRSREHGCAWALSFAAYLAAYDAATPTAGRRAHGTASLDRARLDALGVRLRGVDWLATTDHGESDEDELSVVHCEQGGGRTGHGT